MRVYNGAMFNNLTKSIVIFIATLLLQTSCCSLREPIYAATGHTENFIQYTTTRSLVKMDQPLELNLLRVAFFTPLTIVAYTTHAMTMAVAVPTWYMCGE